MAVAVDRIFSNLVHLQPGFDLATVTEPLEGEAGWKASNSVRDQVDDFCSRFKRAAAEDEDGGEGSELEEEEEGGHDGDEASA